MQPRIYTYKITFEEVPYYYYGSKKEKYFNQEYWGTPVVNKWCWERYTPKKQILELFDYTDEGYEECLKVETRLIKPVLNDSWCLNENCGGKVSLEINRKTGKKVGIENRELKRGVCGRSKEKIIEDARKGGLIAGNRLKEEGKGIFALTDEQKKEICKKGGLIAGPKVGKQNVELKRGFFAMDAEERRNISRKVGQKSKELGLGVCGFTKEQRQEVANRKWQCTETGYITNAGALSLYQKKRGIDTSKRVRI
jgi:general stress protein YciG